jgi:hypothetical protein
MRALVVFIVLVTMSSATPVFAQRTSVSASLVGNLAVADEVTRQPFAPPSRDSRSMGMALRVAQPLAERWGFELEWMWAAETESFTTYPIIRFDEPGVPSSGIDRNTEGRDTLWQQYMTIGATTWFSQSMTERVTLVYSAGIGLTRQREKEESRYDDPAVAAMFPGPSSFTYTIYGIAPLLGLDARIGLTEHLQLVPGIRVQPHSGLWLMRPGVGVAWAF